MRCAIAILCWLIFSLAAPAPETVVPIAYSSYLLGGKKNGKRLAAQEVAPVLKGKIGRFPMGFVEL